MSDEITIRGRIISTQLGTFGLKERLYGYVTIRKENGDQVKVKIDTHTECESLAVGDTVEVHAEELGNTGIVVAKRVELIPGPFYALDEESSTESAS
ncbi:MAG: hypothetical protein ACFFDR_00185 [Candidatus Thorarchaeota archaeon]